MRYKDYDSAQKQSVKELWVYGHYPRRDECGCISLLERIRYENPIMEGIDVFESIIDFINNFFIAKYITDIHNISIENKEITNEFVLSIFENNISNVVLKEWKCSLCPEGESCWCRCIKTVDGETIIGSADSSKEIAEHIVNVHNKYHENVKAIADKIANINSGMKVDIYDGKVRIILPNSSISLNKNQCEKFLIDFKEQFRKIKDLA